MERKTIYIYLLVCASGHSLDRLPKVELHTHIDGSLSPSTLWDIAHTRNLQHLFPKDVKKPDDLREYISIKRGGSLERFLATFDFFFPFLRGSAVAVEMMGKAFVLQQAANNVLYTEGRFGPQLLRGVNATTDSIVQAMIKGINSGLEAARVKVPGLRVNIILCCMRGLSPDSCHELVDLAIKWKSNDSGLKIWQSARVVGIDMAEGGGKATAPFTAWTPSFLYAYAHGVHATVHAGEECAPPESCPANCEAALDMRVTRIGHGYNCGEKAWERLHHASIHIEACPTSSVETGAVKAWANHPLKIYAERNYSFGINTDDCGVLNTNETNEMRVAQEDIGLSRDQTVRAIVNAAKAAFVPTKEIDELLKLLFPSAQHASILFM